MTPPIRRKSNRDLTASSVTFYSRDATVILSLLERTARKLGLTIRYEPIFQNGEPWESDGGLCRFQQKDLIIINSSAPADQKCQVILQALRNLDIMESDHIPPAVRQMLKKQPEHKR